MAEPYGPAPLSPEIAARIEAERRRRDAAQVAQWLQRDRPSVPDVVGSYDDAEEAVYELEAKAREGIGAAPDNLGVDDPAVGAAARQVAQETVGGWDTAIIPPKPTLAEEFGRALSVQRTADDRRPPSPRERGVIATVMDPIFETFGLPPSSAPPDEMLERAAEDVAATGQQFSEALSIGLQGWREKKGEELQPLSGPSDLLSQKWLHTAERALDTVGGESLGADPLTGGLPAETKTMRILRQFEWIPAAFAETIERIPVAPTFGATAGVGGASAPPIWDEASAERMARAVKATTGSAPPEVRAAQVVELGRLAPVARSYWTVGDMLGVPPGIQQRVDRTDGALGALPFGADWAQGVIERVQEGRSLEEDFALAAENRLGADYVNAGWWLGLALSAGLNWEGAALAPARASVRGVATLGKLRAAGVSEGAAEAAVRAAFDPTIDLAPLYEAAARRTFDSGGELPAALRVEAERIAQAEDGMSFDDLLHEAGLETPEPLEMRADLDATEAAKRAARPEPAAPEPPAPGALDAAEAVRDEVRQAELALRQAKAEVESKGDGAVRAAEQRLAEIQARLDALEEPGELPVGEAEQLARELAEARRVAAETVDDPATVATRADAQRRVTEAEEGLAAARRPSPQAEPPASPGAVPDESAGIPDGGPAPEPEPGFAARPGRKTIKRKIDPRPDAPPFAKAAYTERQYWQQVAENEAKRDRTLAPRGYRIKPHDGWERIDGAVNDAPDDAAYLVRDARGHTIGESATLYEASELLLKRRADGDVIFREGSERTVARWNKTRRSKQAPVSVRADYYTSSPAEAAYILDLRKKDPRAVPIRLRQVKRGEGAASGDALAARELAREAAAAETAAKAAAEATARAEAAKLAHAERVTSAKAELKAAREAREAVGGPTAQAAARVSQLETELATLALPKRLRTKARKGKRMPTAEEQAAAVAAETEAYLSKRIALEEQLDVARAELNAHRFAAEQATEAIPRLEAEIKSVGEARRDANSALSKLRSQQARAEKFAAERAKEAERAAAQITPDDAALAVAEADGSRVLTAHLLGAPGDPPPPALTRVHEVIRDAAKLAAARSMDSRVMRLLPDLQLVPPGVYDQVMRNTALQLGVKKLAKNGQAYSQTAGLLRDATVRIPSGGTLERGATLIEDAGRRARALELIEIGRRAGLTDAQLSVMTAGNFDVLLRQIMKEQAGVFGRWSYGVRGMEPWANRAVRWLQADAASSPDPLRNVPAEYRGGLKWLRDKANSPFRALFTRPTSALPPKAQRVWTAAITRLETLADEMVREFRRLPADASPAEKMATLVGNYRGVPMANMDLADTLSPVTPTPATWAERMRRTLASRDELTETLTRGGAPLPRWATGSDEMFVHGSERWARDQRAAAAQLGRDWIESLLQATGTKVEGVVADLLKRRVPDATAAQVYRDVYQAGKLDTPAMQTLVAQLGSGGGPLTKAQVRNAVYVTLLRERGRNVLRAALDDMMSADLAVPRYRGPAGTDPADANRATLSDVMVSVLQGNEHYIDPVTGARVSQYPDSMISQARLVLERWGISPMAGPNAIMDVVVGGRTVQLPRALGEMLERAARVAEDPARAVLPTNAKVNRALPDPLQVWKTVQTLGLAPIVGLYNSAFFTSQILGNFPLMIAGRGLKGTAADVGRMVQNPGLLGALMARASGVELADRVRPAFTTDLGVPLTVGDVYDIAARNRLFTPTMSFDLGSNLHLLFKRGYGSSSALETGWWTFRRPFDWGAGILRELSGSIETSFRLGTLIQELKRGTPPDEAARIAADTLPNYHLLTDTEKQHLKWVIPFYAYLRKSADAYVYALMTNPGRVAGQARVSVASLNERFESDIEAGGLTEESLSRLTLMDVRGLTSDEKGATVNPRYFLSLQSGPVGLADFFVTTGALLSPGALMTDSTERDRVIGLVNPYFQSAAVLALDRKLTGPFTRNDLTIPQEVLSLPLAGDHARILFAVGPRAMLDSEDKAMADEGATRANGGRPSVWAAGMDPTLPPEDLEAGERNWMLYRIWLGRLTSSAHKAGVTFGVSPPPPELTWGQWAVADGFGLSWNRTASEAAVMERYRETQAKEAKDRTRTYEQQLGE
jgi:hypothetical protein